jgi:hypothetical protein
MRLSPQGWTADTAMVSLHKVLVGDDGGKLAFENRRGRDRSRHDILKRWRWRGPRLR